jgi:hypothetical protein
MHLRPNHLQIVEHLPQDIEPSSITLSNKPIGTGGDERALAGLGGISVEKAGLRLVWRSFGSPWTY